MFIGTLDLTHKGKASAIASPARPLSCRFVEGGLATEFVELINQLKQLLSFRRTRVARVLAPAEIERAFDLGDQLRHVDDIFDRVFGAAAAAG